MEALVIQSQNGSFGLKLKLQDFKERELTVFLSDGRDETDKVIYKFRDAPKNMLTVCPGECSVQVSRNPSPRGYTLANQL